MTERKTDIWMPLWIGAYLADTMKLTTLQHGAYFLLLIAYWRERKPLADVDDELRSITKLERAEWKKARPVLSAFFKVADGVWWHKRVEAEILAADARSKKAAAKASKAAQARWGDKPKDANDDASSMLGALPEDMHDECPPPSPTPLPSVDSEAKASAAVAAVSPVDKSEKTQGDTAKSDLWKAAVAVLQEGGCSAEAVCRSFMGKLVGDYAFEIVRDAVASAATAQPVDAREYLKATCMRLKGERAADFGKPLTVVSRATEFTQAALADGIAREAAIKAMTPEERRASREAAIAKSREAA